MPTIFEKFRKFRVLFPNFLAVEQFSTKIHIKNIKPCFLNSFWNFLIYLFIYLLSVTGLRNSKIFFSWTQFSRGLFD